MALQRRRNAFSRYQLQGITETNVEIGRGSFAVVEEVVFHGLSCVGKCIHRLHYDRSTPDAQDELLARFAKECELLSEIRHPQIVQFLGIYFKEAAEGQGGAPLPVIVMERLHCTLASTIDRHGRLPGEIAHPILGDVAAGLAYLHARPVIHRDLSANNVLLATNMSAKIADLGVAKILDLSPAGMVQMTTCPGTPSYMPPEALVSGRAVYTTKIDIFSYGNLMTHVLSGEWPIPTQAFRFESDNPNADPIPISEVERRGEYLRAIGNDHALMGLIRQCLSNNPAARPEASDILVHLENRAPQHPLLFTDRVEALQRISEQVANNHEQIRVHQQEVERLQGEVEEVRVQGDKQVQEKDQLLEQKQWQISHMLQQEVGEVHDRMTEMIKECEELRVMLSTKESEVEAAEAMARAKEGEALAREEELQREVEYIQMRGGEDILEKNREIEQKQRRIDELIYSHTVEMENVRVRVSELSGECDGLKARVRAKEEAVMAAEAIARAKDREATAKEEKLSAVRQELVAKEDMLEAKEGELWTLEQQLGLKNQQLSLKEDEVTCKKAELALKEREVEAMRNEQDAQKEAIAAQDSQLRAKEHEIATQEGILTTKEATIAQLRSQVTMVQLLSSQSKLKWRRCTDMPGAMVVPEVVRINKDIYVGGGGSDTHEYAIFRYNPAQNTWLIGPECPIRYFGLTELSGKLVLVGGLQDDEPTGDVYTLEESGEWEKTLPSLPTARAAPTVFRYESFLVACGGDTYPTGEDYTPTCTVEVFDSKTPQWYNADPLPVALFGMTCAIIDNTCYLIGGENKESVTNHAVCASLLSLTQAAISQADSRPPNDPHDQSSASPPPAIWKGLPECPCTVSAAAGLGGCLLAIGGFLPDETNSGSVHLYSHGTNSWVRVPNADIPQPRYGSSAS